MFVQQIKDWTAKRTLQAHNLVEASAERGGNWITCADARAVRDAKMSGQRCSITEDDDGTTRHSKVAGVFAVPFIRLPAVQPDPHSPLTTKTLLLPTHSNVGALMHTSDYYHPLVHIAAASCLPREHMWRLCEQAELLQIPGEQNLLVSHNPHDMLGSVPGISYTAHSLGDLSWVEERDKDTLREYFKEPTNIVLHSDCPHLAPHIVITPAEETPDDFYTPWNNRTHPQWSGFLMVPPCDLATGRLRSTDCQPVSQQLDTLYFDDATLVDEAPKGTGALPKPVFSHSRFCSFVETTANERLILYHVVRALQKHQCKVAAYATSARAPAFCRRYEAPDSLASIEKPFVWTDPAEPLLASTRHTLGATLIESSCPFVTPHILINSPPPQNPWIPWHNAVNDPQDGRHLIVPSSRVNYINMDERVGEGPEYRWATSSAPSRFFDDEEQGDDIQDDADYEVEDDFDVDHSESPPHSRPSSPGPETPTDDTTFLRGFFGVRRPSFVIDEDDEDEQALAFNIAKNAVEEYYQQSASLLRISLPVIEEEDLLDVEGFSPGLPSMTVTTDKDNDLPPLDDWYFGGTTAQTRTLAPVVFVV